MLNALSQSPLTNQFFEWNEKLQKDEIMVREIISIPTIWKKRILHKSKK